MLISNFWWFLLKLVKMKLLLLNVNEIMKLFFECCWLILLMMSYAMCVEDFMSLFMFGVKLLLFLRGFDENGLLMVKCWCWDKLNEFLFLVICFGCEKFREETWIFVWKASLSDFAKISNYKWFWVSCFGMGGNLNFL